ncbi:hypothetical protein DYB37_003400, partial [Aphanomyces astaci]
SWDYATQALLEQLWTNLKPDVRRSGGRYTKEWGEIGFQGQDPMTDFRFASLRSRALVHASHPTQWYPFAVTGINITRQSNPTDLMAFPAVFGMLQETIRLELAERTFA